MSGVREIMPLGQAVKPTRPRVKPSDYPELPFIGMEHIEPHSMKLLGTVPAGTMKSSAVYFKPGDVLYGRLRPYLNKVYRPNFDGLCSAEFIVLPENERVEGAYLQYFLNSAAFVRYTSHLNAGDRPRVDFDQLAPYQIPIPCKDVQREIVAEIEKQFSRLDEAVANLKRVKANLKRYKASVLKDAVEGRLVPTEAELARREGRDYETGTQLLQRILETRCNKWEEKSKNKESVTADATNLPMLPEGWTWSTADQVSEKITDGEHLSPELQTVGMPLLSAKDVREDGVVFDEARYVSPTDAMKFRSRCNPDFGDILIVSRGATIGRACQVSTDREFCLMGSVILMKPHNGLAGAYILAALKTGFFQTRLTAVSGSTAQQAIYIRDIRPLQLPLPPIAEQIRIVAEVDRRLSLVRSVEAEVEVSLKRAERLRQSVLAVSFSCR